MTATQQLKDVVSNYLESHPNVSINGLAKRSGIGATTIRRILKTENQKNIAPHTVLNLLSTITKEKSLGRLINTTQGPLKTLLKENFSCFTEETLEATYDNKLNKLLSDSTSYLIYKLASNRSGVRLEIVKELYGSVGINKVQELMNHGYLKETEGKVFTKNKEFSLDLETAVSHLPELVKLYKPNQVELKKNLFYSLSESVNEEGIQKIKEIEKEAIQKIYNVMISPFYEGEIPYFTLTLSDTMLPSLGDERIL
ncbi:MAG: hypothetical protein ACPGJV_09505 [Bacteriovoracaceae bacterium]